MARPKVTDESTENAPESAEKLLPFSVIVDGEDRVVFATDAKDAVRQAEKLRSTTSPS